MALQPCPSCKSEATKVLKDISSYADVTYRRCEVCGHVWVTSPDGRIFHHVTPLKNGA